MRSWVFPGSILVLIAASALGNYAFGQEVAAESHILTSE